MGFNPHWTSLTTKPLPSAWEWVISRHFTTYNSCFPHDTQFVGNKYPSDRNNSTGKSPVTVDWFPVFHVETHAGPAQIHHLGALWNRQNFLNGAPMPGSSWADEEEEKDQAASWGMHSRKGDFIVQNRGEAKQKMWKKARNMWLFLDDSGKWHWFKKEIQREKLRAYGQGLRELRREILQIKWRFPNHPI